MRVHWKQYLGVLAVLAMAMPVWAGRSSSRTDSTPYDTMQTVTIGKTQLKPGHYTLKAKESQDELRVLQNGKLLATVPCHWVKLAKKPDNSEIVSNKNKVTRVEFEGRAEALKLG
ncbi:MAG: hypothetical protein ACM3NO_08455 [Deltaproteobacteria bacterium]